MEHVVFHPGPDGSPAFRRFGSLEDAVRFVEHLRNAEGVSEVSVHALAPVQLAFRAYYKVEVPVEQAPVDVPAPSEPVFEAVPMAAEQPVEAGMAEPVMAEAVMPEPVVAEPVMAEPVMAEAAAAAEAPSNGKRSLGFFAH
jgi:ribonuclease E